MKKINLFIFMLSIFLLSGKTSLAGYHHGSDRDHDMMEELNLTDAQKNQLKEIREKYREKMKDSRSEIKDLKEKLSISLKGNTSEKELWKMFEKIHQAKENHAKTRFEQILKIREILTPEQRAKFKGFDGWKKGHHKKYQKMGNRPE